LSADASYAHDIDHLALVKLKCSYLAGCVCILLGGWLDLRDKSSVVEDGAEVVKVFKLFSRLVGLLYAQFVNGL